MSESSSEGPNGALRGTFGFTVEGRGGAWASIQSCAGPLFSVVVFVSQNHICSSATTRRALGWKVTMIVVNLLVKNAAESRPKK
ncbi:hypothetical protein [Timonella senegalensis]|uniref:hypothetical protein n=1 Tax=Timonella senegalensis TaxID=1465825 RepID=UPI002FE2DA40